MVTNENAGLHEHIAINDNTADREDAHWNEVASPIKRFLGFSAGAVLVITAGIICLFVIIIATQVTGDDWMWAKILTMLAALISIYNIYVMSEDTGRINRSQKMTSIWVIVVIVFLIFLYLG